ncbi:unnamed protein product [Sphagnum jensenii]|uniref:Uncharacterized protein n=1 Tax=Sphagnum jensenii TaxID=128206 RepID=A0ABP1AZM8_9BRYO
MLATTHAAVSNAASATPLQPSTAPSTATLLPAPTTPDVANGDVDPWVVVNWEPGLENMHQLMFDMANMRGPNHKCCQIKQDKGSSAMEGKNAKSFLKLVAACVR